MPALVAAGCGSSEPHLARTDVAPLIALANRVAVEAPCAQKRDLAALDRRAIALIDRHAVPARLQESFLSGVHDLAGRTPACVPPASPRVVPQPAGKPHGKHGKGHEKHDRGGEG